jgi:hypothetical protein
MRVEYLPSVDSQGRKIRDFAIAVMLPNSFPEATTKKWKWAIICHGMGERSDGRQSHLEQLAEKGFDWNVDGRADSFFISEDMKKAVDLHETIIVVPTYSSFFEPEIVNRVYDHMIANFQGQPTFLFEGFSLGGEAVFKYISSSEANAQRVHLAVPVAAPYGLSSAAIAAKHGPVVHAFSNDKDDRVNSSNTTKQVSDINGQNPAIKAQYTLFRVDGHGGDKEAMALTPPKAPNGQGVIDAAETIWQLNDAIVAGTRRQIKSGTAQPIPAPQPAPSPLPALQPVVSYKVEGNDIHLIGDKSIGYKTGADGRWEFVSAPAGVTKAQVFPGGSTYINADGKLPKPGTYKFEFYLKGVSKPVEVTVEHGTAAKTLVAGQGTVTLTYADGSQEIGTITLSIGKWVIKNSAGVEIK